MTDCQLYISAFNDRSPDSAPRQQVAERASSAGDTNQILMTIPCLKEKSAKWTTQGIRVVKYLHGLFAHQFSR